MEAGVGLEDGVLAQPNGCRPAANEVVSDDGPRAKGPGNAGSGISFSKELISFSLYGKIPRKSSKSVVFTISLTQGPQLITHQWRTCNSDITYYATVLQLAHASTSDLLLKYTRLFPAERPWNESLSSKIAEVQESFKNIPSMLYFSPSSVTFDGIGVYVAETLPKGLATVLTSRRSTSQLLTCYNQLA